jgi:hypothetical protein
VNALILAQPGDLTARRVAHALRARYGSRAVVELSMHSLTTARAFTHCIGADGTDTHLVLRDGARVACGDIDVVFNRLRSVEVPQFLRASNGDREYAASEVFALLVSWLTSLRCPVINPASATTLSGVSRHHFEWCRLASDAGLPAPVVHVTSSPRRFPPAGLTRIDNETGLANAPGWFAPRLTGRSATALVIGDAIIGDLPSRLLPGVRRLMQRARLSLARCDFVELVEATGECVFAGVDEFPQLETGKEIARLTAALESAAASRSSEAGHGSVLWNSV